MNSCNNNMYNQSYGQPLPPNNQYNQPPQGQYYPPPQNNYGPQQGQYPPPYQPPPQQNYNQQQPFKFERYDSSDSPQGYFNQPPPLNQ